MVSVEKNTRPYTENIVWSSYFNEILETRGRGHWAIGIGRFAAGCNSPQQVYRKT